MEVGHRLRLDNLVDGFTQTDGRTDGKRKEGGILWEITAGAATAPSSVRPWNSSGGRARALLAREFFLPRRHEISAA